MKRQTGLGCPGRNNTIIGYLPPPPFPIHSPEQGHQIWGPLTMTSPEMEAQIGSFLPRLNRDPSDSRGWKEFNKDLVITSNPMWGSYFMFMGFATQFSHPQIPLQAGEMEERNEATASSPIWETPLSLSSKSALFCSETLRASRI